MPSLSKLLKFNEPENLGKNLHFLEYGKNEELVKSVSDFKNKLYYRIINILIMSIVV